MSAEEFAQVINTEIAEMLAWLWSLIVNTKDDKKT
jgi:hypothetical protein